MQALGISTSSLYVGLCGDSYASRVVNKANQDSLFDQCGRCLQGTNGVKPGPGWMVARTEDGRAYFYNEKSKQTTWTLQDTYT